MNKVYNIRTITKDAVVTALFFIYIVILVNFNLYFNEIFLILLTTVFTIYFCGKKIIRSIVVSILLTVFTFFISPTNFMLIVPNVYLGVILSKLLGLTPLLFHLIGFFLTYIVEILKQIIYAHVVMGVNFLEFLKAQNDLDINGFFARNIGLFFVLYFILLAVIVLMEIRIVYQFNLIYLRKYKDKLDNIH